jgi:hypothetical protein
MKKTILYLCLLAFPFIAPAQECSKMYGFFKTGTQLEYTHYNKKGKVESVNTQKLTQIENRKDTLVATFEVTSVNEKGKQLYSNNFPIKCYAGTVFMDMRSVTPSQQNAGQSADMQIEVTGSDLVFPPDMKSGQVLADAEMGIIMRLGSLQVMNTKYFIKNRKVEGEESITTAAGTYKCLKISYDMEYKFMGTRNIHTLYWYAPEAGMVKSVSYDKKGNEEGRIELTKFGK